MSFRLLLEQESVQIESNSKIRFSHQQNVNKDIGDALACDNKKDFIDKRMLKPRLMIMRMNNV